MDEGRYRQESTRRKSLGFIDIDLGAGEEDRDDQLVLDRPLDQWLDLAVAADLPAAGALVID